MSISFFGIWAVIEKIDDIYDIETGKAIMMIKMQKKNIIFLNHEIVIPSVAIVLAGIICVVFLAQVTCLFGRRFNENVNYYSETKVGNPEDDLGEIRSGETIIQFLDTPYTALKGITVYFVVANEELFMENLKNVYAIAELYVDDTLVQRWEISFDDSSLEDGTKLVFDNSVKIYERKPYLKLVILGEDVQSPITIKSTLSGESNSCFVNNTDTMKTIYMEIRGSGNQHTVRLFIFSLFIYMVLFLMLYNTIFYNNFEKKNFIDKCIIVCCIVLCTFFFSQYDDMKIISELAHQLLNCINEGQFLSFYEYAIENSAYPLNANYNILLYIVTSIIVFPVWILNRLGMPVSERMEILYINIILSIVYYLTGKLLRKLLICWKTDISVVEIVEIGYYLNPILLFATIGFEQLDIIYVVVFLGALYLYSIDRLDLFAITMSISIAMKLFPILILFPLILLREKHLLYIIRYVLEGLFASIVFHFVFGTSEAWIEIQSHYDFFGGLFMDTLPSHCTEISIFCFLYIVFCFVCYFQSSMGNWRNILMCGSVVYSIFALFAAWNPQYLTIFAMFLSLNMLIFRDKSKYLAIIFFTTLGYIGYTMMFWTAGVDNYMLYHGILFWGIDEEFTGITLKYFIESFMGSWHIDMILHSIFAAAVSFIAAVSVYFIRKNSKMESMKNAALYRGYLYLPLLPLYVAIVVSATLNLSV